MTSVLDDRAFIASVISERLLEEAIEWIASNMEPEDVFSESSLREWAESNGLVEGE